MPRRKKPARELTTEELAHKLFPKKVREEVKRETDTDSNTNINDKDTGD